jgi:hypothetical protein
MARRRAATDVAISTALGPNSLTGFTVITDELFEDPQTLRHSCEV